MIDRELLTKLLEAFTELDVAFCTYIHRGESGLTGNKYEKLCDVALEVEEYLKEESE